MRVLGVGLRVYLGALYQALEREGHEVRVHAAHPAAQRSFRGMIDTVEDWRAELPWVGRDGVVMFETVGQGAVQDELRRAGFRVVGGSAFGDRLEHDRPFGQALLARAGVRVAAMHPFAGASEAAAWLRRHPGRYALKHDDNANSTFVGAHPEGADVLHVLRRRTGRVSLMDVVEGTEVGIGAYFDGSRFLRPACIDFEHKRFFPGDLGEMTGEMGTLAGFRGSERLFEATLGQVEGALAEAGHVGYVNVNLIVNRDGVWPLEFTCRFGNPGFAVLAPLQLDGWGDLLGRMAGLVPGGTFRTAPGWSVAIVLTAPPFPTTRPNAPEADDVPMFFTEPADPRHFFPIDVRREGGEQGGQMFVRAVSGHAAVVTGTGPDVQTARTTARRRAESVVVPDGRWRGDIGERFERFDEAHLRELGWLP